jgi:hypothetical protein
MKQAQTIPETFLGVGYTRDRAGLPLEAVRVPVPQPAADQVLIRVAASSLNPLGEALRRRGLPVRALVRRDVDMPFEQWRAQELRPRGLPEHVYEHFLTMAKLHATNRYDRLTHDVEAILGRPATSARDFVARHDESFAP